ncbi:AMP-binding protein [Pendulispora brunnea]|uniref:AMP-binding protein n=1 Tax=Pendulispora brunnea TaxID=2905690 RepID=A0ABZ2KNG2_9BACT
MSVDLSKLLPPANNAIELFRHHVATVPDKAMATFIEDGGREVALTFAELDRAATNLARELVRIAAPGERALIAYDSGREFGVALWGALYAGLIAVPVDPPGPGRPAGNVMRISNVATDSGATVCISSPVTKAALESDPTTRALGAKLKWVFPDLEDLFGRVAGDAPSVDTPTVKDVALIQYASGSTGAPKGTRATHGSLLRVAGAFIASSSAESPFGQPNVEVTWLPFTHSMAGYGFLIKCLTGAKMPGWYIEPAAFACSPVLWLSAISRHAGQQVYAVTPNFALDWCVSSTTEAERKQLDLSCWTHVMSMGEKVRPETLKAFTEAFRDSGFRPKLFIAGYGTSETGYITGSIGAGETRCFDRTAMGEGRLQEASEGGIPLLSSSGFMLPGARIEIVDPETREILKKGMIGEIWVATPYTMDGYWNRPEETEELYRAQTADSKGPFFRTGDLGAIYEDHLFITGRRKGVIVVRGRKHYVEDIEATLERTLRWLGANSTIAFSSDVNGVEELLIATEPRGAEAPHSIEEGTDAIRGVVAREFGVRVHEILFLSPGQLPRTGMGKVSRVTCKQLFDAASLGIAARSGTAPRADTAAFSIDLAAIERESDGELRAARATENVRGLLASLLGVPEDTLGVTKSFAELGVDSLTGVRFCGELVRQLPFDLSPAVLFSYPTLKELGALLGEKLRGNISIPTPSEAPTLVDLEIDDMSEDEAADALRAHLDTRSTS